jgi:hypothetical protein
MNTPSGQTDKQQNNGCVKVLWIFSIIFMLIGMGSLYIRVDSNLQGAFFLRFIYILSAITSLVSALAVWRRASWGVWAIFVTSCITILVSFSVYLMNYPFWEAVLKTQVSAFSGHIMIMSLEIILRKETKRTGKQTES